MVAAQDIRPILDWLGGLATGLLAEGEYASPGTAGASDRYFRALSDRYPWPSWLRFS